MAELPPTSSNDQIEVDAVVIGAGFAGLYATHRLRNVDGLSVQSFDNAGDVGGTWYWNRYPGARADTEFTAYCYSFDHDLYNEWTWSERYPRQPEILSYLNAVADRHDLRRSYRFGTTVTGAAFDESSNRWLVNSDDGQTWSAQFLVEGVGLLSSTNFPDYPGIDRFRGELYHSARWPHEPVDFTGKRVAVIGTGSTGVQIIAEVGETAAELTVYQRTPQYIVPAKHGPIPDDVLAEINGNYDAYWASVLSSATAFGFTESTTPHDAVGPEERDKVFEEQWERGGGFQFMFQAFSDIITSREANDVTTAFIRKKISQIVKDPDKAKKLTPQDLYAKRPICCDNYYETFNKPNVELVDLHAHPILEFTEKGIHTDDGAREFDVVILATGFDAVTGNYLKLNPRGRGGLSLKEWWTDRPRAHLGLMTAHFPNMFMIFGPMAPFTNQPPAHEVQVDWIAGAIKHVREHGLETLEPKVEAEDEFLAKCDEIAADTLIPQADSWINGANIPGKRKAMMFYMAGMGKYMETIAFAADNGYEGFAMKGAQIPV